MALPKRSQSSQNKGRVALAIQAFEQGQFSNLKAVAVTYGASYSTVRDRVSGRVARSSSRPMNLKLSSIEESTLAQWILSMHERGLLPRPDTVRQMADLLLKKRSSADGDKSPIVSKC